MIEWKTMQIYLMIFAVFILFGWYMEYVNPVIALGEIAFIAVIFFYYEFMVFRKYPVIAPLFIKRSGKFSFMLDRASRKKDEHGVEYYQLKNSKKVAKPPNFSNIIETVKGYVLPLFSPSQDEYRQIELQNDGTLKVLDEDMKAWYKYNIKKAYSDWSPELSLWVRYQPIIYMTVLGGIVIVIMYIMAGAMPQWSAEFSRAAQELTNAAKNLGGLSTPPPF